MARHGVALFDTTAFGVSAANDVGVTIATSISVDEEGNGEISFYLRLRGRY